MAVVVLTILESSAATLLNSVPTKPTAFPQVESFEIFRDYRLPKIGAMKASVQPAVDSLLAAPMTQSLELYDCPGCTELVGRSSFIWLLREFGLGF
ncbi:hypothetical protein NUU61_001554 [Penicillium alfredii]|uniref:Uncharacterized protein n=1 Tax=Penicillium alfredii TaxID=1506179 RepID=A0A9W9G4B4_9EURO|nr:uncharacterized protein NUU61_001554 [Penicillium alfredii]KAJ5111924.1 hypothetical protein NUU61_001554 [Penicillium alfredii]